MKKPYEFTVLSDTFCIDCGKAIKKNVVERKETKVVRCYKCNQAKRKKHQKNPEGIKTELIRIDPL